MKLCRKTMKRSLRRFYLDLRFNAPRLKRFAAVAAFGGRVDKGILVAGPYIGELGYEIGEWAPHIKWLASHLNCRTHVFARKGREVLYPFAEEVQTIDFPSEHIDGHWLMDPSPEEIELYDGLENRARHHAEQHKSQFAYQSLEVLSDRSNCLKIFRGKAPVLLKPSEDLRAKWKKALPSTPKVVLTYRANFRGSQRNSDPDLMVQTADFITKQGWTPILVGKIDKQYTAPDIPGVDLTNQTTLADLIAIYEQSFVVVGSSTGTIHLAASCGTPHITWGSTRGDDSVVLRYEKEWNLNKTWVRFISKDWTIAFQDLKTALDEAAVHLR